ncbi:ribonuclease P protein subunit [Candidatus Woesearchaeota archaeon]|nr:ribonuclease P protein subunit [Candidatus Woesearchaeota archaeon]
MITDELIGTRVRVLNKSLEGKVVDETKFTFTIKTKEGTKKVLKAGNMFEFDIGGRKLAAKGEELVARPEERIKLTGNR